MDVIKIFNLANELRNMANTPNILNQKIPYDYGIRIQNELSSIIEDIKAEQSIISKHLQNIKGNLFIQQVFSFNIVNMYINPFTLGQILEILDLLISSYENGNELWHYIHPKIMKSSQKLYLDGHYANAAEDAFIEVNDHLKKIYQKLNPDEEKIPDGVDLMHKIIGEQNANFLRVGNPNTETGRNIQQGYHFMLAGAMSALRNPKAHSNDEKLSAEEAMRRLMFASMLMYKIDEAVKNITI